MEQENAETSSKYLRLYEENDKLAETLQNHQYQVVKSKDTFDLGSLIDFKDDKDQERLRDIQLQQDKEIASLQ